MIEDELTGPDPVAADLLAPLRTTYRDGPDPDRDSARVRAMQLVLRMERSDPPSWHAALRLAAAGAALICLDPRTVHDPVWAAAVRSYVGGPIRKLTRRARGAAWVATADLPGITLTEDPQAGPTVDAQPDADPAADSAATSVSTQLRVLVPGPVDELDKRIAKLQVGGTDAAVDDPPAEVPSPQTLRIRVPVEPPMTLGKAMAQVGHASMIAAAMLGGEDPDALRRWLARGCPVDVRRTGREDWRRLLDAARDPESAWQRQRIVLVRDAGFTEIAPGTVTAIGTAPV